MAHEHRSAEWCYKSPKGHKGGFLSLGGQRDTPETGLDRVLSWEVGRPQAGQPGDGLHSPVEAKIPFYPSHTCPVCHQSQERSQIESSF